MPGVLLAAGEEGEHQPSWGALSVGARRPPFALGGRGGQKPQEVATGASQRENQEPTTIFEEEQCAEE